MIQHPNRPLWDTLRRYSIDMEPNRTRHWEDETEERQSYDQRDHVLFLSLVERALLTPLSELHRPVAKTHMGKCAAFGLPIATFFQFPVIVEELMQDDESVRVLTAIADHIYHNRFLEPMDIQSQVRRLNARADMLCRHIVRRWLSPLLDVKLLYSYLDNEDNVFILPVDAKQARLLVKRAYGIEPVVYEGDAYRQSRLLDHTGALVPCGELDLMEDQDSSTYCDEFVLNHYRRRKLNLLL